MKRRPKLAGTPPMGWNSWNGFGKAVDEQVVRQTADALVETGLRNLGYEYVVIDDHWHGGRGGDGRLFPHPERFAGGMRALADYIHGKGLKFGMYSCAGSKTCGGEPGSVRYEEIDAKTFADWHVDFLKYDYCYAPPDLKTAIRRYARMGRALESSGRPMVYSICEWGHRSPWLWAQAAGGNLWRTTSDVFDAWDSPQGSRGNGGIGILAAIDGMVDIGRHSGPGGWNDPDMLVIGLRNRGFVKGGGCTDVEYRTQMSMWCMLAAPLMIGCDLHRMRRETLAVLSNRRMIAINQDPLGRPAERVFRTAGYDVWKRPLADGHFAVALLNRSDAAGHISASRETLGFDPEAAFDVQSAVSGRKLGRLGLDLGAEVPAHGCEVWRLRPVAGIPRNPART